MVVRDPVRFPSGATKCQMRIIGKTEVDGPNGVAALAWRDGRIVLRNIYRHATRSWELEAVRGRREIGEAPRQAARKELKQELGYPVRRLDLLGEICPDSAILSSKLQIFWAELGNGPRRDDPEPTEAFGPVELLSPQDLASRVRDGGIRDAPTLSAFVLAQLHGKLR